APHRLPAAWRLQILPATTQRSPSKDVFAPTSIPVRHRMLSSTFYDLCSVFSNVQLIAAARFVKGSARKRLHITLVASEPVLTETSAPNSIFGGFDDYQNLPRRFPTISVTTDLRTVDGSLRLAVYPVRNAHGGPCRCVLETATRSPLRGY